MIDMQAARRESEHPDGITIRTRAGTDLTVPAELPADVLDPFLSDDLDLMGLLGNALAARTGNSGNSEWLDSILTRQALPKQAVAAIKDALRLLFGEESYAAFVADRPSVQDYIRLVRGLADFYGVGLGEAFASLVSSASDGETPNQTSLGVTGDSTFAAPGDAPEPDTATSG